MGLLVIVGVVALSAAISPRLASGIRYAGLALQLLGVATVVRGLRNRGKLFDRPPIMVSARAWLSRFPRYSPKSVTLGAGMSASASATLTMSATVWRAYRDEDAIELRIKALAQNLDTVRSEISETSTRLSNQLKRIQQELHEEQSSRAAETRRLASKLEDLGAGGLHIELIGVVWLVFGIAFATIPGELVELISLLR